MVGNLGAAIFWWGGEVSYSYFSYKNYVNVAGSQQVFFETCTFCLDCNNFLLSNCYVLVIRSVTLHKSRDLMGRFLMWWLLWLRWKAWQVSSHFIFTRFLWGRFCYLHFTGMGAEVQRREVPHPKSQSHAAAESRSNRSSLPSLVLMLVPTLLSAGKGTVVSSSVPSPGRVCVRP